MEALSNLGNGLTKLKDYHTAWTAFEQALKVSPGNGTVIENYMLCLLEAKRFDAFEEMMEKFVYLAKEKKDKLEKVADEYRNTLGIRVKKHKKPGVKHRKKSITSAIESGELSKKESFVGKPTELSNVEEEKE